jgi:hypothetical protein
LLEACAQASKAARTATAVPLHAVGVQPLADEQRALVQKFVEDNVETISNVDTRADALAHVLVMLAPSLDVCTGNQWLAPVKLHKIWMDAIEAAWPAYDPGASR